MATPDSRVTIHMAASLDGYIARKDGSVDWLETSGGGTPQAPPPAVRRNRDPRTANSSPNPSSTADGSSTPSRP